MIIMDIAPSMQNFSQQFLDNFLDIVGNPMYIGLLVLLFFFFLIISVKITMDIAIVIYIPIIVVCSVWIPPLRILFGIIVGVLIALGILRLIGKR